MELSFLDMNNTDSAGGSGYQILKQFRIRAWILITFRLW